MSKDCLGHSVYASKIAIASKKAFNADGSLMTCIGNDYGYEAAFSRQIEGLAQPGDLVIGITSSGNSQNILLALETAQKLGLDTIALLGRGFSATGIAEGVVDISPSARLAV